MSLIGELNLSDDLLLFGETFDRVPDAQGQFEDVHYVTDEEGNTRYVFFWWVTGCDSEAFERALDADPTVSGTELVTVIGDRPLYRITTTWVPPDQSLVYPFFRDHDVTTIDSRRDADGLHLRARFPDRETLHAFLEMGEEIADTVEVVRLYAEDSTDGESDGLTRKQREALSRALERGYFDTPSRTTLEALAEEFDVTAQTLSRHIRVGVKKLVENAVEAATRDD